MTVRVQIEDFDLSTEIAQLRAANPQVGAIVSFVGTVRDVNRDTNVIEMLLEHYPGMTEKAITRIVTQARLRWTLLDTVVIHRVGALKPLDQIVLVAVIAVHRGEAFAACEFIMDYLKTEVPFWKKETTQQGMRWVDARVEDDQALARWGEQSFNLGGKA